MPMLGDSSDEGALGVAALDGEAVGGCGAAGGASGTVCLCGVAFVAVPAILWIIGGDGAHLLVAVSLGED